jgi:hypothetical protein
MDNGKRNYKQGMMMAIVVAALSTALSGCGPKSTTFSLLTQSQTFKQATPVTVMNKLDVLWVIDNSGSMDPLQANLVANFNSFISNFTAKGFDYKMAVTTTDAYLAAASYNNNPSLAKFRDGAGTNHTGYFMLTPSTPNILQNFVINATQGGTGSGDERAFQSLFESLKSPLNAGFLRSDAFLAVIILSDEDDFSDLTRPEISWRKGGLPDHDYADPNLMTVNSVVAQLDTLTGSTAKNRRYNVSAITVLDQACMQSHAAQMPTTLIGQRYIDLANATNGVLGSICDTSYATSLDFIQQHITELSTQFYLSETPNPATIQVMVDNQVIAQDAVNGWTYDSSANSIVFHGSAVPTTGAQIGVSFDPVHLL